MASLVGVSSTFFLIVLHVYISFGAKSDPLVVEPVFTMIVDGIPGAEGPLVDRRGNLFMMAPEVEENGSFAGKVLKVNVDDKLTYIFASPVVDGHGGIPAGAQSDKEGDLWIADMRLGVLKITRDGRVIQHRQLDNKGNKMQGCNDCTFDYNGALWVTAPAGDIAPAHYRRSFSAGYGSIYCMLEDGQMSKVDTGLRFPNGLAVLHSKDKVPLKLIVAETPTKRLWGYNIMGPGNVTYKSPWGLMPGNHEGGADGMDFDEDDNLLVANWGSGFIEVFSKNGGHPIKRIKCPFSKPSNIHFLPNSNTVYVTEHDTFGLWSFHWERKGKPQYWEV